jgi:hypothetical protein
MLPKSNTGAVPNGIQFRLGLRLNDLEYADDIVIMAHTFSDIQQKLEQLNDNAKKIDLNINYRKTKLTRIKSSNQTPQVLNIIEDVENSVTWVG